jgi:4-hydroxybenzoate polyprenyltransferase
LLLHRPGSFFKVACALFSGRAAVKEALAGIVNLPVDSLPLRDDFCEYLKAEAARGRKVCLLTGANEKIANGVAARLGFFSGVFASDSRTNLVGRRKAEFACAQFGERGFVYAGNGAEDLHVWAKAAGAVLVNTSRATQHGLQQTKTPIEQIFGDHGMSFATFLKPLRLHQWAKNALVFAPAILSHRWGEISTLTRSLAAFVSFSLMASALYIINDLSDLDTDRRHSKKCHRPFASGQLGIPTGILLAGLLSVSALLSTAILPLRATLILLAYMVLSLAYSLRLKTLLAMDMVLLGIFYTVRIIFGGAATGIEISVWTLAFSLFVFTSLAFAKRLAELHDMADRQTWKAQRRPYLKTDRPVIAALACASAYSAVLTLSLYINSPEVRLLYSTPQFLWLIVPLLIYWLTRFLIISYRAEIHHDPVMFALKDRASWAVLVAALLVIIMAK